MANQQSRLNHIFLEGFSTAESYTSTRSNGPRFQLSTRNRQTHGTRIKTKLQEILTRHQEIQEEDIPHDLVREDVIYVEFTSDENVQLAFDNFQDDRSNKHAFLFNKKEVYESEGEIKERHKILAMMTKAGVEAFLEKVEDYIHRDTPGEFPKPRQQKLIANIEEIREATLESFWNEKTLFPEVETWWEVWLRRTDYPDDSNQDERVVSQLQNIGAQVGNQ